MFIWWAKIDILSQRVHRRYKFEVHQIKCLWGIRQYRREPNNAIHSNVDAAS